MFAATMLIQRMIPNGIFATWEPQKTFSAASQNFDQCCNTPLKNFPKSFRWNDLEMTEKENKSFKSLKKPPQIFVSEPIEDLSLEPRFLTRTLCKPKKV
jgi:hypothetical protein